MAGHKTRTHRHEVAQTGMSDKHTGLYHTCTHTNTQECDKRAGVFWLPKMAVFLFCFLLLAILLIAFAYFVGHHQAKKINKRNKTLWSLLTTSKKKAHNFKKTLTQDLMIENYISLGSHKSTSRLRKGDLQMTSANLVSHIFSHIRFSEE